MRMAITALLLMAGCSAAAPAPQGEVAPSGNPSTRSALVEAVAALPPVLAGFQRMGPMTDYERLPGGAGMGASASYVPANGDRMLATIYIYDRGRPRQVDGGASPEVAEELRTAAAEIGVMVRVGRYRSASFAAAMDVREAGGRNGMRCLNFRVVQQDGVATGDSACVSVQRSAFVKVRLTAWVAPEPAVAGLLAARLLAAVLDAQAGRPSGPPVPAGHPRLRTASLAMGRP